MRPCLDSCEQSTLMDVERVFYEDTGMHIDEVFSGMIRASYSALQLMRICYARVQS